MEQRIFHGAVSPQDFARALSARFNRGNLQTQQFGQGDNIVVQIATRQSARAGGATVLTVTLQKVEDGVSVQVGKQAWIGLAASLGQSALAALRNPFYLLGRLDDIAQDIENLQLSDEVWQELEQYARAAGATFELSERLRRLVCSYCRTANPVGEPSCIACGAPLGEEQPATCPHCGFVVRTNEAYCPNCRKKLFIPK